MGTKVQAVVRTDSPINAVIHLRLTLQAFCEKHTKKIHGVLSCFDRMLFRGYLPIMSGAAMAQFLQSACP